MPPARPPFSRPVASADPVYTVSGARDHYREQARGAGNTLERVPVSSNYFADGATSPRTSRGASSGRSPRSPPRALNASILAIAPGGARESPALTLRAPPPSPPPRVPAQAPRADSLARARTSRARSVPTRRRVRRSSSATVSGRNRAAAARRPTRQVPDGHRPVPAEHVFVPAPPAMPRASAASGGRAAANLASATRPSNDPRGATDSDDPTALPARGTLGTQSDYRESEAQTRPCRRPITSSRRVPRRERRYSTRSITRRTTSPRCYSFRTRAGYPSAGRRSTASSVSGASARSRRRSPLWTRPSSAFGRSSWRSGRRPSGPSASARSPSSRRSAWRF